MNEIRNYEWESTWNVKKKRLGSVEAMVRSLRCLMEKPSIRRNGALYSAHALGHRGLDGEYWHLSWMIPELRMGDDNSFIRQVDPKVDPAKIPGNAQLPAIARYYRLSPVGGKGRRVTRQMSIAERCECIWQALGDMERAGLVTRGRKRVDYWVRLHLPKEPKRWEPLDSSIDITELRRAWDPSRVLSKEDNKGWRRVYPKKPKEVPGQVKLPSGKIKRPWDA